MKSSSLYKYYKFSTLETQNELIFSYVLPGNLNFINELDSCGIFYKPGRGLGNEYQEFDIDLAIPQKNEFGKVGDYVNILHFDGFNYSNNKRIDFSSGFLSIPYAIKFCNKNEILVLNEKLANHYISKYPNLALKDFITQTLSDFSK